MTRDHKPRTSDATAWGRCVRCRLPGLAFERQFADGGAQCGFCGGTLRRTEADLGDEAARVVAQSARRAR